MFVTANGSTPLVCVLQVGNLGLLFMLLFFIYAALGVELFGELGKCCFHVADPAVGSRRGQSWCERAKQNTAEELAESSNEIPLLGYETLIPS